MERLFASQGGILPSSEQIRDWVQSLKPAMPKTTVSMGLWNIFRTTSELSLSERQRFVEVGALPLLVDVLKNEDRRIGSLAAMSIGNLAQQRPDNRDHLLNLGVIPLLTKMIKLQPSSPSTVVSALVCLELMVDAKPLGVKPLELLKDLPLALIPVLDNKSITYQNKIYPGIYSIVSKLCDSGSHGIDIVLQSAGLRPKLISGLKSADMCTLAFAIEAVKWISYGTIEQKKMLMEDHDLLDTLVKMFPHPDELVNNMILCILSNLHNGLSRADRKSYVQKMNPEVLKQGFKQVPKGNNGRLGRSFLDVKDIMIM